MNQPPTRFTRYLRAVAVELATHPEWRPGQACVNVTSLYPEFRDLPEDIFFADDPDGPPTIWHEVSPYNHDDRVPAFLAALAEHWAEG